MLGVYIKSIERKVQKLVNANNERYAPIYWERWFYTKTKNEPLYRKTNYYYYFITLGVFIGTPIASIVIGCFAIKSGLFSELAITLEFIVGLLALAVLTIFTVVYCRRILKEG